eukprot:g6469.t1
MDWSTPWKTLATAVDSAQKAFDELEQTNTGEKPGPGTDSRVERNREGKLGNQNQSEDFFQTNMTPIEKAGTPSIHEEKLLETNTKKKQKDGDDWWLKDGHTVQTNKRKQKKDKITTAKRQLKISTPQSSNTSTAKPKVHGSNELRTTTAPSPKHNDESPSTAEIKSPIAASNAASDKAKSSKGILQQQNEKLRRNLQKAIQAAKDARAQRQRLSQEVKEVKSINSNLQQKLEENTKVINKLKLANGTLTSTNEALEAKVESMTKQLTVLERTQSPVLIDDERHEQLEIEPTNRLDVINDDGTKGTLLNDSTALSIKATKQHMAQVAGNNGKQDIDETIIVNVENSHMPTDTRLEDIGTNEKLEKLQNQLVELQNKLTEQQQNAAKTKMVLEETLQKREEQLQGFAEKMASLNDEYQQIEEYLCTEKKEHALLKEQFEAVEKEHEKQKDASTHALESKKKLEIKIIDLQNELNEEQDKRKLLMEEGIALSKKQAAMEKQIKDLKASNATFEKQSIDTKDEYKAMEARMAAMQKKLQANNLKMAENEATFDDHENQIQKLNNEHVKLKQKYTKLQAENKDLKLSLEASLENLKSESNNLRNIKTELEKVQLANKESKEHLNEHSNIALEMKEMDEKKQQTIESLRQAVQDIEKKCADQERGLLEEISRLKEKNELSERRNEELSSEATNATKPLLRQIRTLQKIHEERGKAWDSAEEVLTQRLASTEAKLGRAESIRRSSEQKLQENVSKMIQIEEQLKIHEEELKARNSDIQKIRDEKVALGNKLEALLSENKHLKVESDNNMQKVSELENERDFALNEKEALASKYDDMQSRFKNTQALLEKERLENEHARQIQQVAAKLAYAASGASDKDHDDSKHAHETDGQDQLLSDVVMSIKAESGTIDSDVHKEDPDLLKLYEAQGNGPLRLPIINLRRTMRHQWSHMNTMKKQLRTLEMERNELSKNLLETSSLKEELAKYKDDYNALNANLETTKSRQTVLLELLGEKEEEVSELNDNIATMKSMYRQQTNDLLSRIESLSKS